LEALNRSGLEGITFHEPFGYLDYNKLQLDAKAVISDSGTISEESAIAGFKAVSLRDSIERPEALESGSMMITGLDPMTLISSLELGRSNTFTSSTPEGYQPADFSDRVLKFLFSTATKHKNWKNLRG
jgi:UDP-N-acetylglucosamine 2-epimerase (non-hydrolysing)